MEHYRRDFPVLGCQVHNKPLIYFDSAATAQKPQAVIDCMTEFYQKRYGTVHRAVYYLASVATEEHNRVREKVAAFLGAKSSEEIIFTRGSTESINLVASSFSKQFLYPGDEILISEIEHHANIVPWQMACKERQAHLKAIPVDDRGCLDLAALQNLLTNKTKLVAISHISNALGTIHPIREIVALAHAKGAKVLIDGAQAVPHLEVNVQELDVDFYLFSGHKIYGPTGIGILYGKKELLDAMPPYQGGGDMIDTVTLENTTYNDLPLKFEAGTPSIAEAIGLGAAIDYIQAIGLDKIRTWEEKLLAYATDKLQQIKGLRIIGTAPQKGALISFVIEGIHHLDLGTCLDLEGIAIRTGHHCAQTAMHRFGVTGTSRISFGLYNTCDEIDKFIISLQNIIKTLQ